MSVAVSVVTSSHHPARERCPDAWPPPATGKLLFPAAPPACLLGCRPPRISFCTLLPLQSHLTRCQVLASSNFVAEKVVGVHPVQLHLFWSGRQKLLQHIWFVPHHMLFASQVPAKSYDPKTGPSTPRPTKPSLLKTRLHFTSFWELITDFVMHQTRKSIS